MTPTNQKRDSLYRLNRRKRSTGNKLFIPIIVIVFIAASAAGIALYRGFRQDTKVRTPAMVQPSSQQQAVKVRPSQEQLKPQQIAEESKPAPPLEPIPDVKPETKPFYSVQVGAFKNEANSAALVKKYRNGGYEAFAHKTATRDEEILYRVLIGHFENKKEAAHLAKSIRSKEKINVIIFHE